MKARRNGFLQPISYSSRSNVQHWLEKVCSGEPARDERRPTEYFKEGGNVEECMDGAKWIILE